MKEKVAALMALLTLAAALGFTLGSRERELDPEEAAGLKAEGLETVLAKTTSKPWRGEAFVPGTPGGTWNSAMIKDPKSFNLLVAERDAETAAIVGMLHEYLVEYDVVRREWKPRIASFEIVADEAADTLRVIYTLRDDLYWSLYGSKEKVKVSSDDMVFWYNEIEGDPAFRSSSYNSQFMTLPNGEEAHIDIQRIDERRFSFNFPRIVAEPLLSTNTVFGPKFIYEKAKRERGVQGVLDLFSVDTDPRIIPSMGPWFLTGYQASQRLVFERNPDYWEKDARGQGRPYPERRIVQILPDENTQLLIFKEGNLEAYGSRPEDLDDLVKGQSGSASGYTVFNAEGSLGAQLWSFNQNPKNRESPQYEWFTRKEFRQAMSCLLNRDRIASQVFRGLAQPKLDFFPEPNPYYNGGIKLAYTYDPRRAESLLASIGMKRDRAGVMRDSRGRALEFDLSIPSDVTTTSDTASIIMDEAAKIGIKINIRHTDFQKLVEQLSSTFDWSSVIIGLGTNFFPTQGSNVWPSTGNLHLWHPLQEKPATEWEARVDHLYNEGKYTIDRQKAAALWDEYQRILLEQCPVIYLTRPRSFYALRNRWDFSNVYYDNLNGAETNHIFIKQ